MPESKSSSSGSGVPTILLVSCHDDAYDGIEASPALPPLDESGDAAVLAQAKAKSESLFRFAEIRHKARQKLIEQGRLVDVLRSDAALEGSVSDAEDIVEATLLKAGVQEPIAELTRTMVSTIGRVFLGLGPSYRDMVTTTRKLYGDERSAEQKAADRERLMGAIERLKVKVEKQKAEAKERAQEGVDL